MPVQENAYRASEVKRASGPQNRRLSDLRLAAVAR